MAFDLEAEVRDLAARRDIAAACMRYIRGQDRLDPDLHRSAFHEGAYVDCGLMAGSAEEFVAFAQGFLSDLESSQHILGQMDISIHGDRAEGEIYFFAQHRVIDGDNAFDLLVSGRYVDEYECRAGDWRIVKRYEIVDWVRNDPATDQDFREQNPRVPFGQRGGRDFSSLRNWPV
ncbi:conserved hypothetical protein [Luminiphilus syltensis NOR5-1B]|uniref:SnoaL-like domain-containing protein n=1 Tax=Luminiphilus syltensis NOR5-1B TaxID=565045 RepID=B8KSN4_9GAMM|nr:nuclear transport factor 2 family protein [Luminiphilus syltensis]EED36067.1 conserved hypothetical protein [Luminiphilus syltensis NOR5-1B]